MSVRGWRPVNVSHGSPRLPHSGGLVNVGRRLQVVMTILLLLLLSSYCDRAVTSSFNLVVKENLSVKALNFAQMTN